MCTVSLWSSLLTEESVVESLFRGEAAAGAAAATTAGEAGAAGAFVAPAASAGAVAAETAATPPSSFPPFFSFFDLLRFNVTGKASRSKVRERSWSARVPRSCRTKYPKVVCQ